MVDSTSGPGGLGDGLVTVMVDLSGAETIGVGIDGGATGVQDRGSNIDTQRFTIVSGSAGCGREEGSVGTPVLRHSSWCDGLMGATGGVGQREARCRLGGARGRSPPLLHRLTPFPILLRRVFLHRSRLVPPARPPPSPRSVDGRLLYHCLSSPKP